MHLFARAKRQKPTLLISSAVLLVVVLLVVYMLFGMGGQFARWQTVQLEGALKQACVTCFAVEGRYPANVAYIEEHYGVAVDWDKYIVSFDAFADNVMPTIKVIPLEVR